MMGRLAAALSWLVLPVCLLGYLIAVVMFTSTPGASSSGLPIPVLVLAFLTYPAVGALIVTRRPRNTVGWIFCAIGLGTATTAFSGAFVAHALAVHADGELATGVIDAVGNGVWVFNLGMGALLLLVFPDGRPLSRGWRLVFWVTVVMLAMTSLADLLMPGPLEANGQVVNPLGVSAARPLLVAVDAVGHLFFVPLVPLAVASLIVRYRRAQGEQRQQIKWFVYGAALMAVLIFATAIVVTDQNSLLANAGFGLGFLMLPLGAGIGVLRYRLYDIDIIINRTLVYGSLTLLLAAVYFGCVVGLQHLVSSVAGVQASNNPLIIVVSTLLIIVLFSPLRRRIQATIDRRFYRAKYDTAKTLERFAATLRSETNLSALSDHLVGVVDETMRPTRVSLWLRPTPREGAR